MKLRLLYYDGNWFGGVIMVPDIKPWRQRSDKETQWEMKMHVDASMKELPRNYLRRKLL